MLCYPRESNTKFLRPILMGEKIRTNFFHDFSGPRQVWTRSRDSDGYVIEIFGNPRIFPDFSKSLQLQMAVTLRLLVRFQCSGYLGCLARAEKLENGIYNRNFWVLPTHRVPNVKRILEKSRIWEPDWCAPPQNCVCWVNTQCALYRAVLTPR